MYRVNTNSHPNPLLILAFAALLCVSGVLCFCLQKDWFVHLNWLAKVPVYALLGLSTSFALIFAFVDTWNEVVRRWLEQYGVRPLVENDMQVYLVVISSVLMGFLYGLVFGLLDIEDEELSHIRVKLLQDNRICYPIGAVVGGVSGAINEYLRASHQPHTFDPTKDDIPDDEF